MRVKQTTVLAAAVVLLTVVGPMFAHHGSAAYDTTQETTVKGTVTDFQFVNPHTLIFFDVKNDKGVVEHWQAEAMSPNQLTRDGWNKNTLKPGDQITITGYRAKNGSNILRFRKMALSNGQEIKGGLDF